MTVDDLLAALDLPAAARVSLAVPKRELLERAPTPADRRRLAGGLGEARWVATLKPTTCGVPAWRDAAREYLEIAVLQVRLRDGVAPARPLALIHRAICYPVLLLTEQADRAGLSLAHVRWSQSEAGATVLDDEPLSLVWDPATDAPHAAAFTAALALGAQPPASFLTLYQGWLDTVAALLAARSTGVFRPLTGAAAAARRDALREVQRLDAEAARLRAAAGRCRQMARRIALNADLHRVTAARAAAFADL